MIVKNGGNKNKRDLIPGEARYKTGRFQCTLPPVLLTEQSLSHVSLNKQVEKRHVLWAIQRLCNFFLFFFFFRKAVVVVAACSQDKLQMTRVTYLIWTHVKIQLKNKKASYLYSVTSNMWFIINHHLILLQTWPRQSFYAPFCTVSYYHMHIAAGLKGLKAYKAATCSVLCDIAASVL